MIHFKFKILIPCVATMSIIRRDMYDTKILWLIGLIFELRISLSKNNYTDDYTYISLRTMVLLIFET